MNTQQKNKFQTRLSNIEYQLKMLQEAKEILVKGKEPRESAALALNEVFRQEQLDALRILELEIKLAKKEKKFWIF